MEKYIMEYDCVLIENMEKEMKDEVVISGDFDKRIKDICERKVVKKKQRSFRKAAASVAAMLVMVIGAGAIANAATGGKVIDLLVEIIGASVITDENRELIGKEVVSDGGIVVTGEPGVNFEESIEDRKVLESKLLAESHIVTKIDEKLLLPFSLDEFEVTDGVTPEIMMTNGAATVFYQGEYEGWNCDIGNKLIFEFGKYESEVVESQTLVIGYVLDGIMYDSREVFRELDGKYELEIEKEGEYHIYMISAASDYLTLKEGKIRIK